MLNLATYLERTAKDYPEATATILDDTTFNYAELAGFARRVANVLQAKGIGPGDKVALMVPSTFETWAHATTFVWLSISLGI